MKSNILKPALVIGGIAIILLTLYSFRSNPGPSKTVYMQVCTVESIIPAGIGRSKMMTITEDGNKTEEDLQNFYSMVGINFGNITGNNSKILAKINNLTSQGWELDKVVTGTQSPSDNNGQGIFISRYFFKKSVE